MPSINLESSKNANSVEIEQHEKQRKNIVQHDETFFLILTEPHPLADKTEESNLDVADLLDFTAAQTDGNERRLTATTAE